MYRRLKERAFCFYSKIVWSGITMFFFAACSDAHELKTGWDPEATSTGTAGGPSTATTTTGGAEVGTDTQGTADAGTTETDETADPPDNPNIPPNCGNGVLDPGEVCDDGNRTTELPPYNASDCIDDCSLLLSTCGNNILDPGEICDDGNSSSLDACTQSCTHNNKEVHAACSRTINGESDPSSEDITAGVITNCENAVLVEGLVSGCVLSYRFFGKNIYAAEGDCQNIALSCDDSNSNLTCELAGFPEPIGNYDQVLTCPAGHVLIDKTIETLGLLIRSKVCQRSCQTDRDCRWHSTDDYWGSKQPPQPFGQYRCVVTPLSQGQRICSDPRNDEL